MVGEVAVMQSDEIKVSHVFDENEFHRYFELYLRSHDRVSGPHMVLCYGLLTFLAGFLGCIGLSAWVRGFGQASHGGSLFGLGLGVASLVLAAIYIAHFLIGVRMCLGRRPQWERARWKARTSVAFYRLANGDTENPACAFIPDSMSWVDGYPDLFADFLLGDFLTPPAFYLTGPFDEPIAIDVIPGLVPRYPMLEGVELSVRFSAAFYPDRIEKGSHRVVFARSYADVHDVVEDKRYPGLAILRHENGYSQLVVRTDLLAPGEWDEVKGRIERAKEERLRGLGPVARARELFK